MVLTYGVETVAGKSTWRAIARLSSFMRRKRARALPRSPTTASNESSHSSVSAGSMSGTWCEKPSKITGILPPFDSVHAAGRTGLSYANDVNGAPRTGCTRGADWAGGREPTHGCLHRWSMPREPRSRWLGVGDRPDRYASGAQAQTTNQRMELTAVIEAVAHHGGPLEIVSDSTYVVRCFQDRWWVGGARGVAQLEGRAGREPRPLAHPHRRGCRPPSGRNRLPVGERPRRRPLNELVDRLATTAARFRGRVAAPGRVGDAPICVIHD